MACMADLRPLSAINSSTLTTKLFWSSSPVWMSRVPRNMRPKSPPPPSILMIHRHRLK